MRIHHVSRTLACAIVAGLAAFAWGCSSGDPEPTSAPASSATTAPQSAVKARRSNAALTKAQSPAPPTGAEAKTVVGRAEASLGTANDDQDSDSFWIEEIDIDDDGEVETTELVWDDEDKVLFLSTDGPFTCVNGERGDGQMLMAIFADGNTQSRPSGSGWWLTGLDAGECGVKDAGLYGCRFDGSGLATQCGSITVDETSDDIVFTTIQ